MKRKLLYFLILLASLTGCQTTRSELKPVSQANPGVTRERSLAPEALLQETTDAVLKTLGVEESEEFELLKFVIQRPVGQKGRKAWREMWLYNPEKPDAASFIITFRENGAGQYNLTIQQAQNKVVDPTR